MNDEQKHIASVPRVIKIGLLQEHQLNELHHSGDNIVLWLALSYKWALDKSTINRIA